MDITIELDKVPAAVQGNRADGNQGSTGHAGGMTGIDHITLKPNGSSIQLEVAGTNGQLDAKVRINISTLVEPVPAPILEADVEETEPAVVA